MDFFAAVFSSDVRCVWPDTSLVLLQTLGFSNTDYPRRRQNVSFAIPRTRLRCQSSALGGFGPLLVVRLMDSNRNPLRSGQIRSEMPFVGESTDPAMACLYRGQPLPPSAPDPAILLEAGLDCHVLKHRPLQLTLIAVVMLAICYRQTAYWGGRSDKLSDQWCWQTCRVIPGQYRRRLVRQPACRRFT